MGLFFHQTMHAVELHQKNGLPNANTAKTPLPSKTYKQHQILHFSQHSSDALLELRNISCLLNLIFWLVISNVSISVQIGKRLTLMAHNCIQGHYTNTRTRSAAWRLEDLILVTSSFLILS